MGGGLGIVGTILIIVLVVYLVGGLRWLGWHRSDAQSGKVGDELTVRGCQLIAFAFGAWMSTRLGGQLYHRLCGPLNMDQHGQGGRGNWLVHAWVAGKE
jgi:hypothetical protein